MTASDGLAGHCQTHGLEGRALEVDSRDRWDPDLSMKSQLAAGGIEPLLIA